MPDATDYRDTVFLPKTDFPMKAGLARKEPEILARWERIGLYEKIRAARKGRERFILHDGPPYANGDIHIGHAMMKTIKDFIVRSQSLMGKDAPFIPGWDCHGLPIEWKIEEQYRKKKLDKDQVPAAEFRAECRAYAEHWVGVQSAQFQRLGITGDWADPYRTMDFAAEAAIVGELLKFAESGQLYRGAKPVMWSPVEKTALAEAEVEYEDVVSTQIDVAFEIVESSIPELVGAHAVVWTTTPWTIPVNQAIAFGPNEHYHLFYADDDRRFLMAFDLFDAFQERSGLQLRATNLQSDDDLEHLRLIADNQIHGAQLAGTIARHPMHHLGGFFAKPRPFLPGDFVTTDQGTGLVHMAPDHGEDDFDLCKANGIEPVFAVEGDGKYRADWAWLGGQGSVINPKFNAPDGPICADLREAGALLAASADYKHSYPHSWRSKAKVIFRATPQWFVVMDQLLGPQQEKSDLAELVEALPSSSFIEKKKEEGLRQAQASRPLSNGPTLRELALTAIAETRWVPARAQNRITAMVEGRPDWVLSRQRAWGVPIALYVNRRTGDYLVDRQVNARIVEAFKAGGADAWFAADHAEILGPSHALADYEPITDILDVWFDSGSTHVFVIEARYGEGVRADLYCEGSDQHRGWFQSSLLEGCGTRGRAPFAAVLTHGFALDAHGKKMSKSIGNVVDPLRVIEESGADILRMWVAGSDYFDDIRIGKDVLAGASDQYRKLRNTFRYLLGALDGFADAEALPVAEMPELERYVLHLLAKLDGELRDAANAFEFNRYARALLDFCNEDLSAFYFDIRKDSLYCDAPGEPKRRACRTVLDILFHALVRYATPIIPFTAEEVWQSRYPSETGSVHVLEWPVVDLAWTDDTLALKWRGVRLIRNDANRALEGMRRAKDIGSSLEAEVGLTMHDRGVVEAGQSVDLAEILIVSKASVTFSDPPYQPTEHVEAGGSLVAAATSNRKCGRCWRHLPEVIENGALCARCKSVVAP